jgi:hypothetical protein
MPVLLTNQIGAMDGLIGGGESQTEAAAASPGGLNFADTHHP